MTAPLDGVVVSRDVVAGEVVDTTKVLFVVADVRTMWLMLDLRLEDAEWVALGQQVRFWPDGGQEANGRSPGSAPRPTARPARSKSVHL